MANIPTVSSTIWTDELHLMCPGATAAGVSQALLHSLRYFCQQSGAFRVELWDDDGGVPVPFNAGSDIDLYDFQAKLMQERLSSCDGTSVADYASEDQDIELVTQPTYKAYWPWDVIYVIGITYYPEFISERPNGMPVQPAQTPHRNHVDGALEGGRPRLFATFNSRPGAVRLLPATLGNVADREGIVPWVALGFPAAIPAIGAIPVAFQTYWYDTILSGAAARLMAQQDKPYTNAMLATYHQRMFRKGIAEARDMGTREFNPTERNWHFPFWA